MGILATEPNVSARNDGDVEIIKQKFGREMGKEDGR